MLDRIKKALESVNKALGGSEKTLVEDAFSPVAKDDSSLPSDVASYVVSGEPSDVLRRVGAVPEVLEKVGIHGGGFYSFDLPKYSSHRKLLASLHEWAPPELLRLAHVYFAATKAPASGHRYGSHLAIWSGGYEWLETFLRQLTSSSANVWTSAKKPKPTVSLQTIEAMLELNQQDPAQLARGALLIDTTNYGWNLLTPVFRAFPDLKEMIERQPGVVREAFAHSDFKVRVHALEMISTTHANALLWRQEIAAFLVASSKLVRQAAEPLVRLHPVEFRELLERHASEGDNETRSLAVQACDRIYREDARSFLVARREVEKAKKVIETLDDILRVPTPGDTTQNAHADDWNLPPVSAPILDAPLDSRVREDLRACLEKAYNEADAAYQRIKHQKWAGKQEASPASELLEPVFEQLQHGVKGSPKNPLLNWRAWREGTKRITDFPAHRDFTLVHLVRWCVLCFGKPDNVHWFHWANPCFVAYTKAHGLPALRELSTVVEAVGLDPDLIGRAYLSQHLDAYAFGRSILFQQPDEGLWPYFAERLPLLEQSLGGAVSETTADHYARYLERYQRRNALKALAAFPRTPRRLLPILWDVALKGAKIERLDAQAALSREPDTVSRLIASLSNGQMEVRSEAAAWLGRLKAEEAKEALLAALKKEKKETAQSAMMLALEALGVPPDQLVDRAALEKEAAKQAVKELPSDLQWFPFATLPALHWADTGKLVPPEIVRWLVVQAFKVKTPEPGPLLRTYAGFFAPADRTKLARYLVEAWIAEDTIPAHTAEEAARLAEAQTQQAAQYWAKNSPDWDEQKHYRAVYNQLLTVCKGSAIGSKGILAVAGAFGAGDLAVTVHRYVKQYFGMRGAQSKALLQTLAWIDDPNAIQVLLAIGNRFRTKGIQEEASRLCQELAERKNWTLDELADRTIPTAGLDEDGVIELDFGARTFTARLNADLALVLTNAEGREISSLPDPNKADDEEKAKQAKQALSLARKELKNVLKMQQERLYEAMCTQRSWSWGDFRRFILSHPIVGRLCERLVWCVVADGKTRSTFRPLPDRTLTNTDDDAVELDEAATIRLAHEATVSAETRDAWIAHLSDYKVEPLFAQFGKPAYALDEKRRDDTEIGDFRGHVLESFKLRGRLTKLGYTRGQPQDGGWFMEYHKRFPGLGVQATVHFSGSPLPEENRPVALLTLSFDRIGENEGSFGGESGVPLGELPPVLVNECWNDLRLAAAEGKGFDPNWEKTVQY